MALGETAKSERTYGGIGGRPRSLKGHVVELGDTTKSERTCGGIGGDHEV